MPGTLTPTTSGRSASNRTIRARSRSGAAVRLDLQHLTTMLAVDRVGLVPVQAAFGTFMLDLGGLENGARELHEERHADDHDEDGQELAAGRRHRDVAETRGRQRGYREIECVDIACRTGILSEGEHEDQRGRDEDEDEQVDRGEDRILVAPEEQAFASEIAQEMIGMDQA